MRTNERASTSSSCILEPKDPNFPYLFLFSNHKRPKASQMTYIQWDIPKSTSISIYPVSSSFVRQPAGSASLVAIAGLKPSPVKTWLSLPTSKQQAAGVVQPKRHEALEDAKCHQSGNFNWWCDDSVYCTSGILLRLAALPRQATKTLGMLRLLLGAHVCLTFEGFYWMRQNN